MTDTISSVDVSKLEHISTRQVAARIRTGRLPEHSPGGIVRCACHPDRPAGLYQGHAVECDTESLRFWSKGDLIGCSAGSGNAPALAIHEKLGIVIDTRL